MTQKRKFRFDKLVRDKIVDQITEAGNKPKWKVLDDLEYISELKKKIIEESSELANTSNNSELVEELADVQELIDYLIKTLDVDKSELYKYQTKKIEKAGAFDKKLFVEYVETDHDSEWCKQYESHPDKYPEIK